MTTIGIVTGLCVLVVVAAFAIASVALAIDGDDDEQQDYDTEFDRAIDDWSQMRDRWSK